jgi:hypothetical protein
MIGTGNARAKASKPASPETRKIRHDDQSLAIRMRDGCTFGFTYKRGHLAVARGLLRITRQMYQIRQLLVRWQIYDTCMFYEQADERIDGPIERLLESTRATSRTQTPPVGNPNPVFRQILIQYT